MLHFFLVISFTLAIAQECPEALNPYDLFAASEKTDIRILLQDLKIDSYTGLANDAGKIFNPDLEHFTTTGDQFGRMNVTSETRIWFNLQLNDKRRLKERVVLKEQEMEKTQRELVLLRLKKELFHGVIRTKQILRELTSITNLENVLEDLVSRYQKIGFLSPEQRVEFGALELALREVHLRRASLKNEQGLLDRFFQRVLNKNCHVKLTVEVRRDIRWPVHPPTSQELSLHAKLDELALSKSEYELDREEAKKVPDLKVGPVWQLNRLGQQEYNIFGLAFVMPMPFTDRNQGLRQSTEMLVRRAKLEADFNRGQRALEIDFRKERYSELLTHLRGAGDLDRYDNLVAEYKGLFRRGLISIPSLLAFKRELMNLLIEVHGLEQELAGHFLELHYLSAPNAEHSYLRSLGL